MMTKEEPLLTLKAAALELGIPYFKIQRAARRGLIPTYSVFNSRKYVKLSELLEVMFAGTAETHRPGEPRQ